MAGRRGIGWRAAGVVGHGPGVGGRVERLDADGTAGGWRGLRPRRDGRALVQHPRRAVGGGGADCCRHGAVGRAGRGAHEPRRAPHALRRARGQRPVARGLHRVGGADGRLRRSFAIAFGEIHGDGRGGGLGHRGDRAGADDAGRRPGSGGAVGSSGDRRAARQGGTTRIAGGHRRHGPGGQRRFRSDGRGSAFAHCRHGAVHGGRGVACGHLLDRSDTVSRGGSAGHGRPADDGRRRHAELPGVAGSGLYAGGCRGRPAGSGSPGDRGRERSGPVGGARGGQHPRGCDRRRTGDRERARRACRTEVGKATGEPPGVRVVRGRTGGRLPGRTAAGRTLHGHGDAIRGKGGRRRRLPRVGGAFHGDRRTAVGRRDAGGRRDAVGAVAVGRGHRHVLLRHDRLLGDGGARGVGHDGIGDALGRRCDGDDLGRLRQRRARDADGSAVGGCEHDRGDGDGRGRCHGTGLHGVGDAAGGAAG